MHVVLARCRRRSCLGHGQDGKTGSSSKHCARDAALRLQRTQLAERRRDVGRLVTQGSESAEKAEKQTQARCHVLTQHVTVAEDRASG